MRALALLAMLAPEAGAAGKPTTIMTVLIDDLGWADTQIRNPYSPTPHIGQLAYEGIVLEQHHVYRYCSPTRRSILSGRFPVHIWGIQAPVCSNYLPLQFTLLPAKLKEAGFQTHMIGKGHLGYQTTDHLPIHRGFDSHVGYLEADEQYYHGLSQNQAGSNRTHRDGPCYMEEPDAALPPKAANCRFDMWEDAAQGGPELIQSLYYSANVYAARAISKIEALPPTSPLYIHLTWQNVHGPYEAPPVRRKPALPQPPSRWLRARGPCRQGWENEPKDTPYYSNYCSPASKPPAPGQMGDTRCNFAGMLKTVDDGFRNVTEALVAKGRWASTLMVVSSDNGGIGPGNNHPLRGSKMTPCVPSHNCFDCTRSWSCNQHFSTILCARRWQGGTRVTAFVTGGFIPPELRGTSNSAIMHVADWYPTLCNLVGVSSADTVTMNGSPRPIDGIDVWPLLLSGAAESPREYLPTTEHSLIWKGRYKLMTNAGGSGWYPPALGANDTHDPPNSDLKDWPCVAPTNSFIYNGLCAVCSEEKPCLFDIRADPGERVNLASKEPQIVAQLAKQMASYVPYVNASLSAAELSKYDCVSTEPNAQPWPSPWWGMFNGPCCRAKTATATTTPA